ncbi:hypothetical protein [Streptomyces sp. KN37]|nr:hypothetical protein [Streptomyces sp. KN37]WPO76745.1 hypothetical protein R9806_39695 [Streptomyces sp. KN37]
MSVVPVAAAAAVERAEQAGAGAARPSVAELRTGQVRRCARPSLLMA